MENNIQDVTPVIIESPLGTDENGDRVDVATMQGNINYALDCMSDSLNRGEAPFASHLLYTQVLDDSDPEERRLGMNAGFAIGMLFKKAVAYTDRGISSGMTEGIKHHIRNGRVVEYRELSGYEG